MNEREAELTDAEALRTGTALLDLLLLHLYEHWTLADALEALGVSEQEACAALKHLDRMAQGDEIASLHLALGNPSGATASVYDEYNLASDHWGQELWRQELCS